MVKIIETYGDNVWIFLKLLKMFFRFLYKLLNFFSLNNFIFIFFLLVNLYYLSTLFLKKKIKVINAFEAKLIFLSFIGFFGFLQSFMIYETFRNINSTIGIFFFGTYIINKINFTKKVLLILKIIIIFTVVVFLKKFPNVSNNTQLILKNDGRFIESSVNYFPKNNLLTLENSNYYKNLNQVICHQNKKIINLSFDFVLPYVCDKNIKKFSSMGPFFLKTNPAEHKRIFKDNILFDDEILITSKDINSANMRKIFEVDLPGNLMWFSIYDNYSKKIFGYTNF
jgi:hypothetical protein